MCVSYRFSASGKELNTSSLSVVVGVHNIDVRESSQSRHFVETALYHEKYDHDIYTEADKPSGYDIMLLKLKSRIRYNKYTTPICIDRTAFPTGTTCIVSGWGTTNVSSMYILYTLGACARQNNRSV